MIGGRLTPRKQLGMRKNHCLKFHFMKRCILKDCTQIVNCSRLKKRLYSAIVYNKEGLLCLIIKRRTITPKIQRDSFVSLIVGG